MYIKKYSESFQNALGSGQKFKKTHWKRISLQKYEFCFSKLPFTVFDQKIQNTFSNISCFKSKQLAIVVEETILDKLKNYKNQFWKGFHVGHEIPAQNWNNARQATTRHIIMLIYVSHCFNAAVMQI